MIFGKTYEEKKAQKLRVGDTKIIFAIIPKRLRSGKWVWLEWVRMKSTDDGFTPEWYCSEALWSR